MSRFDLVNRELFRHCLQMTRWIIFYALVLAAIIFALEWIEYQYLTRAFATEFYIVLIGVGFTALGIWLGRMLTSGPATPEFELNKAALQTLRITEREYAVLEQIASGQSNKQIALELHVSPNTVKSHIAHLYEKLDVSQRVQAVQKARDLRLIP